MIVFIEMCLENEGDKHKNQESYACVWEYDSHIYYSTEYERGIGIISFFFYFSVPGVFFLGAFLQEIFVYLWYCFSSLLYVFFWVLE